MATFNVNQIVRGVNAGVFVILAHRMVGERFGYQVKEVNPANLAETAPGESFYSPDMLKPYNA